ncbi:hypothetical protein [Bifidobacterium reuteri]|uniref:hypothetical protein n=1 Tax=Bifidobacterium reuteri TaxID=983706 RepID=UPI00168B8EA1|nr:hypothetical protein [Bifidobacterium reuteri]
MAEHEQSGSGRMLLFILAGGRCAQAQQKLVLIQGKPWVPRTHRAQSVPVCVNRIGIQIIHIETIQNHMVKNG